LTHHEVMVSNSQILDLLPEFLSNLDQPTVDGVNVYVVSHAAKQLGLKVALSGLGSDELFGGYPSFSDVPRALMLRQSVGPFLSPLLEIIRAGRQRDIRAEKLVDLWDARADIRSLFLARRRLFTFDDMRHFVSPPNDLDIGLGLRPKRADYLNEVINGLPLSDALGRLELEFYMGQMLLRDTDVMGMANNLEIRAPFLDDEFASCALSLEADVRRPRRMAKWYFAQAMEPWLPPGHTGRPKRPFHLPFGQWMTGPLKAQVGDSIEALAQLHWPMDPLFMRDLWRRFQKSPRSTGWFRPWSLFVLHRFLYNHNLLP
jgi:asparagine synthase (glutamine-hydrolysing)